MANEATVFSILTADLTGNQTGGDQVEVASADAATVPANIVMGLYLLKANFETGAVITGKARVLALLEQIRAKIVEGNWPAV